MSAQRFRTHIVSILTLLGLLLATLFAGMPATQAAPSRPRDPNQTAVSSDGSLTDVAESAPQNRRLRSVSSFAGTGELVAGGTLTVNDTPVPAIDGSSTESIIGSDSRYQIGGTTTFPYRAIVQITFNQGAGSYMCTGWMIGNNTVATAGHCVFDNGAWASNVRVYPGRNGNSTPYGSCTARTLYSVTGWTQSKDTNYDYGAIKLNCTVGNSTGWFGFRWTSSSMNGQASYLSGYPGDKSYGTQWRADDSIRLSYTRLLYYANDTYGGMSGAPVWNSNSGCNTCGISIHTNGTDGTSYNHGTRITQDVFNNLINWRNA